MEIALMEIGPTTLCARPLQAGSVQVRVRSHPPNNWRSVAYSSLPAPAIRVGRAATSKTHAQRNRSESAVN
jgi:hypothetical protein